VWIRLLDSWALLPRRPFRGIDARIRMGGQAMTRLEMLKSAEHAVRTAVEELQPLNEAELIVMREIVWIGQRVIWDSLGRQR
jgi:hypothetical protein